MNNNSCVFMILITMTPLPSPKYSRPSNPVLNHALFAFAPTLHHPTPAWGFGSLSFAIKDQRFVFIQYYLFPSLSVFHGWLKSSGVSPSLSDLFYLTKCPLAFIQTVANCKISPFFFGCLLLHNVFTITSLSSAIRHLVSLIFWLSYLALKLM